MFGLVGPLSGVEEKHTHTQTHSRSNMDNLNDLRFVGHPDVMMNGDGGKPLSFPHPSWLPCRAVAWLLCFFVAVHPGIFGACAPLCWIWCPNGFSQAISAQQQGRARQCFGQSFLSNAYPMGRGAATTLGCSW